MRTKIVEIIKNPEKFLDQKIEVCGWARTVRDMKGPVFISLNDGSCFENLQVVILDRKNDTKEAGGTGSSFRIEGILQKSPGKNQNFELLSGKFEILGKIEDPSTYPLAKSKTKHSNEFLRTVAHLRPRTTLISSIARVRNTCAFATHSFFNEKNFLYIHTPIVTTSDSEGAGEMLKIARTDDGGMRHTFAKESRNHFFGKQAYLTVSGQLNLEAYACALSDVYTFGPTFRAENSNTSRHLAEFWMIEPEICFATLKDNIDLAEAYIKYVTKYVLEKCPAEIGFFESSVEPGLHERLQNVLESEFMRITYTKAVEILSSKYEEELKVLKGKYKCIDNVVENMSKDQRPDLFDEKPEWGNDLNSEHEKYLTKIFDGPVVVTNYPRKIKAFYMKVSKEHPETVEAMDILVPKIGELVGGSAREENLETLDERIKEMSLKVEDFQWYRDLRRYGTVPHAGFGVGFERLVMFMTGTENIRDVIPFPRWPGHCEF
jgi:asparaginyl-tRNA synthetase